MSCYSVNPCIYACVENVAVIANETVTGWKKKKRDLLNTS